MSEVPPNYAQYPRPNYQGGSQYSRPPGVYVDVFSDAWKMVTSELATWLLGTIIMGLVCALLYVVIFALQIFIVHGGNLMAAGQPMDFGTMLGVQAKSFLVSAVPSALMYMMFYGLASMAVSQARGLPISASDVFKPFTRFGPVFVATLLTSLCTTLGSFACIVPGIYLAGALSLSSLIATHQEVSGLEALRLSMKALGSQAWLMFVVLLIGSILSGVGFFLCLVGALFTVPLFAASLGLHYHYFFPPVTEGYAPSAGAQYPSGPPSNGPY